MVGGYIPRTYNEALDLLSEKELMVMAGGTDLMVKHRSWSTISPRMTKDVLFIKGLEELNYIDQQGQNIHIGATVTLEDLLDHFHTPELLYKALSVMASPAIRHSATLVGNIMNASPAGDSLPVIYVLDAIAVLESHKGLRHVPVASLILGPGQTAIHKSEMVKEVIVSEHHFNHLSYKKVGTRKADAIAKVCFCGAADVKKNEVKDIRIAIGAVGPTVLRDIEIEESICKMSVAYIKENHQAIAKRYEPLIQPIDDQRSTKNYRKQTALNLIGDFLKHI